MEDVGWLSFQTEVVQGDVADPFRLVYGQLGIELVPYKACCCSEDMWP